MLRAIRQKITSRVPAAILRKLHKLTPMGFFTGGFAWDSATLTRVDNYLDNFILLGYLICLGLCIVLMYLSAEDRLTGWLRKHEGWYPNMIQFFMGGLISSYVIFYFHSASMTRSLLFVLILFALLVANEFLHNSLKNIYLTMGLYFFVAASFMAIFIPVITSRMNYSIFLISGMISLSLVSLMAYIFMRTLVLKRRREMWSIISMSVFMLIILNALYLTNWIPPVPLSVKYSGIYHSVERNDNTYALSYVKPQWYEFWRTSDTPFMYTEGDRAYCFSSIFAPTSLKKKIYHHWYQYLPSKNQWLQTDRLGFTISGGRGQGWRGYTYKQHIKPGKWRVDIRTEDGLLLGRIAFKAIPADTSPTLITHHL